MKPRRCPLCHKRPVVKRWPDNRAFGFLHCCVRYAGPFGETLERTVERWNRAVDAAGLTQPPTRLAPLQNYRDGDNPGDCMRTAIAMVLGCADAAEVPHFFALPKGERWAAVDGWLADRALVMVRLPLPGEWSAAKVYRLLPHWLRGTPAILMGRTAEGNQHAAAVVEGEIVGGDLALCDIDGLWWVALIVPMRVKP